MLGVPVEDGQIIGFRSGDSQISFSAGEPYLEFFQNLRSRCAGVSGFNAAANKLGALKTAAIGVRSTSLHSWTAKKGVDKDTICAVDKKFGVNAGAFGINGDPKRKPNQARRRQESLLPRTVLVHVSRVKSSKEIKIKDDLDR